MYEYDLFNPPKRIMDWTDKHRQDFCEYRPMAESDALFFGAPLSPDVSLRYEICTAGDDYTIEAIHAIAKPWRKMLRRQNFKLRPAFRPKDAAIWHTVIDLGENRAPIVVAIPNGGIEPTFSKIRAGGIFPMQVTGLIYQISCRNKQGTLRLYEGPTLEMHRRETNDPTLESVDLTLSHLRSLNAIDDDEAPAFAEFSSVIEIVEKVDDAEWPSYRLLFWSGQPSEPSAFPVQAIVPKHVLQAVRYVPRVGDAISGTIALFGQFPAPEDLEADASDRLCQDEPWDLSPADAEDAPDAAPETPGEEPAAEAPEALSEAPAPREKAPNTPGYELLPRPLEVYPEVEDFGHGLTRGVAKALPKYVLYRDYHRAIQGKLRQLQPLQRTHLRAILEQIPQLFKVRKNVTKSAILESTNILHAARDPFSGERHLWIALAPVFPCHLFHTDLLVAIDDCQHVLRYTLLTEDASSAPHDFRMFGCHWKANKEVTFTTFQEVEDFIHSAKVDDFFCMDSAIYSTLFQAKRSRKGWQVEWQHHYIHWQFKFLGCSNERLIELMHVYVEKGFVPLQTMANWQFVDIRG